MVLLLLIQTHRFIIRRIYVQNQLFNQSILAEVLTLTKQTKKKLLVFENTNIEENLWSNSGEWKVAKKEELRSRHNNPYKEQNNEVVRQCTKTGRTQNR